MKKITRSILALSIILSSCSKEPNWSRSWSQPLTDDPLGVQGAYAIPYHDGMSEQECIDKIKSLDYYDPSKPLFISPNLTDYSNSDYEDKVVPSPDPDYMYFPHIINSMSDYWSWDYIEELKSLRAEHGAEGTQMFLDKYLDGDSTIGMKLKNF